MTRTEAQRAAKTHNQRRRRRLMAYGQWQPMVDAQPARQYVLRLQAGGLSLASQAAKTGIPVPTLCGLLYGKNPYPPSKRIRSETAAAILSFTPTLDDYPAGARIDATGTVRRLRALAHLGWTSPTIGDRLPCSAPRTIEQAGRSPKLTAQLARSVRAVYTELSNVAAEEMGVTPWIARRRRNYAIAQGWAPPAAWDDDTIDDPNAQPDWTGFCGTDRGWWTHRLEHITVCEPCQAAHDQWLQDRKHLSQGERYQALGRARAEASNRGAAIAEDARELMRLGADYETAAQRIGVTRNHLQQELLRHPELRKEAA
ncbi:hypothetical protein [Streptomyces sp. NPDC006477]|uniref:hypothetical protein n=1 Tax=Streptomyces sp. NPDC006477 TaxID=3364747 RepID=UPI0036AE70E9